MQCNPFPAISKRFYLLMIFQIHSLIEWVLEKPCRSWDVWDSCLRLTNSANSDYLVLSSVKFFDVTSPSLCLYIVESVLSKIIFVNIFWLYRLFLKWFKHCKCKLSNTWSTEFPINANLTYSGITLNFSSSSIMKIAFQLFLNEIGGPFIVTRSVLLLSLVEELVQYW